jgi:hypothetical protein
MTLLSSLVSSWARSRSRKSIPLGLRRSPIELWICNVPLSKIGKQPGISEASLRRSLASARMKVGCPRNNQIFFSVRTETNRNSICFGCFWLVSRNQKTFFRFVSLFRTYMEKTETNRILLKQTKKISKKWSLLWGSSKPLIFFSVRTETK